MWKSPSLLVTNSGQRWTHHFIGFIRGDLSTSWLRRFELCFSLRVCPQGKYRSETSDQSEGCWSSPCLFVISKTGRKGTRWGIAANFGTLTNAAFDSALCYLYSNYLLPLNACKPATLTVLSSTMQQINPPLVWQAWGSFPASAVSALSWPSNLAVYIIL